MRHRGTLRCVHGGLTIGVALSLVSALSAQETDLEALKQIMTDALAVKVEHEEKLTPATDSKPPLKSESWTFRAGLARPMVRYSRYLNRPPDYEGDHPSLPNTDTGIGFDGGAWGNWYRGNALRVILNGADVFAAQPAKAVEWHEGAEGRLRLAWELEAGHALALTIHVPADGHALHALVDLSPAEVRVDSLQVRLSAYPGGYGPYHRLPSHRWVATADQEAEVPKDDSSKDFPVLTLTPKNLWVFYADKYVDSGSLGLLMLPEEKPSGEILVSNYGVSTTLDYPPGTRKVALGFYAYDLVNAAARRLFLDSLPAEHEAMKTLENGRR